MRTGDPFYSWSGPRPVVEVAGTRLRLPVWYHDVESFLSLHLAEHDAVAAALPTTELVPVRWFDGRAAVMIWALRYREVTSTDVTDSEPGDLRLLAPYGEVGVSALVARRPTRKGLAMLRPMLRSLGGFVLQLPVTTPQADEFGRAVWGLPKYVADMDFAESVTRRSVTVSERGKEVLRFEVNPAGPITADKGNWVAYSVLEGRLVETAIRAWGHGQARLGHRSGRLDLGAHAATAQLRELSIAPEAQRSFSHVNLRLMLPGGKTLGPARPYHSYRNEGAERGRLTVAFPGTGPIDPYVIPAGSWGPLSAP